MVGVFYGVVGIVFGRLAGVAGPAIAWRWAAWLLSAIAFAAHIRYEFFRLRHPALETATHAAQAAALGAFLLALAATIHAEIVGTNQHHLFAIALVAWPALAGIPAFLVALALTAVFARTTPPGSADQRQQ